jgi:hypothetical protein
MTGQDIKKNMLSRPTWTRGLFMLMFAVIYGLAEIVITAVVVFQFFYVLITGKSIEQLLVFGQGLSTFVYDIMLFLTYNTEEKPFPFGPWTNEPPKGGPTAGPEEDKPIDYSI